MDVGLMGHARAPRMRARLRGLATGAMVPLAVGLALLTALQLGRRSAAGDLSTGLALAGALSLVGLIKAPRAAVYGLLVLTCTFWIEPLFPLAIGGLRTDVAELTAFALVALWALYALLAVTSGERRPASPFYSAAGVLVVAVAVGAVYGASHSAPLPNVIANAKTFLLYLLVLPICWLFGTRARQAELERAVLILATLGATGVLMALSLGLSLQGRPGTGIDVNDLAQTLRVRPALLPLLFLATMLVVARISSDGMNLARLLQLALFLGVWAVTYNRTTWVSLILAGLLLVLIRPGSRTFRRTVTSVLLLAATLPLTFVLSANGTLGPVSQTVAARLTSVVNNEALESNSLTDRQLEYREAIPVLERQPVFGVGVGGLYGARRAYFDQDLGIIRYQDRGFSHNSWLYLYLQLGVLGLGAVGLLSWKIVKEVGLRRRHDDLAGGRRATAAGCALLGGGVEAIFNPNLLARPTIVALCVCLALIARPRAVLTPRQEPASS